MFRGEGEDENSERNSCKEQTHNAHLENMDSDQDDFLDKHKKMVRPLDLYLQLPDEDCPEVVRDY